MPGSLSASSSSDVEEVEAPQQRKIGKRKRPETIELLSSSSDSDNDDQDDDDKSSSSSSSFSSLPTSKRQNGQRIHSNNANLNNNNASRNNNNNNNSTASNTILNTFLQKSANSAAVKQAVALHQKMMESDEDSSSTGSDFGQLWGLTGSNSHDDDDNSSQQQDPQDCEYISNSSDSDSVSDSSIEILIHNSTHSGMNGRHLSGRQRRLEAARSKNTTCTDDEDSSSSSDDDDMDFHVDHDDSSAFDETGPTHRKARPEEGSNTAGAKATTITSSSTTTPITSEMPSAATTAAGETPQSDAGKKTNKNGITKSHSSTAKTVGTTTAKKPARKGPMVAATKSSSPIKKKKKATKSSKHGGVFDNLFSNGKDFLTWAGITDPHDFLKNHKEYAQKVNLWRRERNLPIFNDPDNYIRKLKVQVKDNLKAAAAAAANTKTSKSDKKQDDVAAATKHKKKRRKNKKIIYPSMDDLPMEGGDFMKHIGIKDVREILKHKGLHKHVNVWRKEQNLPLVDNERLCVANWRKWIRQNTIYNNYQHQQGNTGVDGNLKTENVTPEEIDFSNCMEVIESLSKRFLNSETGLPVYQFAVYDTLSTDIIYEFRVEAKPSLIPNAGNGAFLTFLGAREASCPGEESDVASQLETIQPLISRDFAGYHMNIKIAGEHLQEDKNSKRTQYPPPTSLPPIHEIPEKLNIGANSSQYPWALKPDAKDLLSRYVENSEILFSTNHIGCSVIELGRYGPFRRSDRKFQLHYDLKNFVFSNEVSEWGFDVIEDLNGNDQVADVTDDATGMPHSVTKQNVSMYVNETGGDSKLKQTVWSGQVMDREVNYYFKTETPMKKGETIELLISYFGTYDEVRERKGYGERNKSGHIRSDDHFPSFLERNFVERYDMVEVIYEVEKPMDLYLLSEFLESIRANLARIVEKFVRQLQTSSKGVHVPYAQQIIALRRLNWLKPFFLNKIESFEKRVGNSKAKGVGPTDIPVLRQCTVNARYLEWPLWPILMDLLEKHPNLIDGKGINVRSKFRDEVTEDVCYGVSSSLFCPCNETVWCNAASTLTHDLSCIIARDCWDYANSKHPSELTKALIQKTVEASEAIRNPKSVNGLVFDKDIWKRYALNNRGGIAKEPCGTQCLMVLASDCKWPEKRLPVPYIVQGNLAADPTGILTNIHKPWYLVRQILFLADTFAKKYLANDKTYSFDYLRQRLGLTPEATSMYMKRDIELDLESSLFYGTEFESIYSNGNRLNSTKERSSRKKSENKSVKKKAGKQFTPVRKLLFWDILIERLKKVGWNIERGNRPNDWYLLPPGVQRGKGFKPRVDFFDSGPLVINCLKTDTRYCNQPAIKSIMKEYRECQLEFDKMKSLKSKELKLLSNKEVVELLRKKVGSLANESSTTADTVQNSAGVTKLKAVFHSQRLGLLLHTVDGQVVVKGVPNQDFGKQISAGDVMIAVGDFCTRKKSLADACALIVKAGRPVTITFERKLQLPLDPSLKELQSLA